MPALGGRQPYDVSLRDKTKEITTHTVYTGEITALTIAGLLPQMGAYNTAVNNLTLGVLAKTRWGEETIHSNDPAASNLAQRENKLLITYRDAVTEKPYQVSIGTIDLSVLHFMPGAGDSVAFLEEDGATDEVIAWVAAFVAMCKSPDNEANAVEVLGMRYVGRNS